MKNKTTIEKTSDRELVVTRSFNGPVRLVFQAWTTPELLMKWWVPRSVGMTLVSCEADVRAGGRYRFVIKHPKAPQPLEFFGQYLEVVPNARLVWTNEEGGEGGSVTTVTFEEEGDQTRLVMRELYPSREAFEAAGTGAAEGMRESFDQLDELLVAPKTAR